MNQDMRGRGMAVWLATVGGVGYLPWAPGTWGSLVGLLLGVLGQRWIPPHMAVAVLALAYPLIAILCTEAEDALGRHDAPPIVLDEVVGMALVLLLVPQVVAAPVLLVAAFFAFRIFDIAKPPPLRLLARLPAGWGILADDLGAAAYTIALLLVWKALAFSG